ncbi:MAG: thymidine phosphorylase [Firmicutes bacterium]|nr:thymidine phosphorylase [Bacillota bacterium]
MSVLDLIRKKRDGGQHSREEIEFLVRGYTRGTIPDYQMAAWLMAVVLRGMSRAETTMLTEAMLHSGAVLDLSRLPAPKVDKHSTGGVGDKTSLVVAPVVAAAGLYVPMISGRGLGHTGGTLDKLEAIPGFDVRLSLQRFRSVLARAGCALIGQTAQIAPADRKLYALRDATATVESPALICASIMSKKLAEDLDALVLDVKVGSGAFLKQPAEAAALAELLVETATAMGTRAVALLTDMDQPLGHAVGNALEVAEALEVLRGGGPDDLATLSVELAAHMLHLGGRADTVARARQLAHELLSSGRALERFREVVRLQDGDVRAIDDPARLPRARHRCTLPSPAQGYVAAMDTEAIGRACVLLGGGRERKEDSVDPAVGLTIHKKIGAPVQAGEPLCTLHYNARTRRDAALERLRAAWRIAPEPPPLRPLILAVIGAAGG